jgi:hypothetical protein
MSEHTDAYLDALVEIEAREAGLRRLLALVAPMEPSPLRERGLNGLRRYVDAYIEALIDFNDQTPDEDRAQRPWVEDQERRKQFALTVEGVLEVLAVLEERLDPQEAESDLGRKLVTVMEEAAELDALSQSYGEDEEVSRQIGRRHMALLEHVRALDAALPEPLKHNARLVEFLVSVRTRSSDVLDRVSAGWRDDHPGASGDSEQRKDDGR